MKKKYLLFSILTILLIFIWACTKKVETIISIDYEINEDFESEGFVNGSLPTTVNIVPIQVLEGFDYFIKYEVESGNGFYSSGSGIIAPNEFMPLTGLNFTANYIPSTPGTHSVKFTIRDEVGLEESTTLTYTISNLDLNWVATTNVIQEGIGQEIPITLTFANNTEGSTATFTRTVRLTSGTANLSNSAGAVALNTKAGITPGTYNFTAVASETGTLTIEFELEDNSGQIKTTRVSIDITTEPVNQAPVAVASADITNGKAPLTVRFDGSRSSDPEEGTLTYSWNLTNESGTFNETLTGDKPSYVFTNPGIYTATLTVTDAEDATGTDTVVITVSASDNVAPTASIDNATPISGAAPLSVSFTGSGTDSDGTITNYSWNFGDGTSVVTGATPSHEFTSPGTYTVTLTVRDNGNAIGTATIQITVSEPANVAPTASIDNATPISGVAPLSVSFTGSGTDPDGTITNYSWNFGDGTSVVTGATPSHIFTNPGTYTVTLTVRDNGNAIGTATIQITVSEPANVAPTASIDIATPISGTAPLSVDFTGSGTDQDGTITSYSWNFGDGNSGSGQTTSYIFAAGTYDVVLTVTDNDGAIGTGTIEITVSEPEPKSPISVASVNRTSGEAPMDVTFDGSGSSDPDGTISNYSWLLSNGTTLSGISPNYTFTTAGTYTATLTVTDDDNETSTNTNTNSVTITVTEPIPNQIPIADPTASTPTSGVGTYETRLNGSRSSDPDNDEIVLYEWGIHCSCSNPDPIIWFATGQTLAYDVRVDLDIYLRVTDSRGGVSEIVSIRMQTETPTVSFFICCGIPGINLDYTGNIQNIVSYNWEVNGPNGAYEGIESRNQSRFVGWADGSPILNGIYYFRLTVVTYSGESYSSDLVAHPIN